MGKETPHIPRCSGHGQVSGVEGATDSSLRLPFPLHITVYILLTCFQLLIAALLSLSSGLPSLRGCSAQMTGRTV